MHVTCQAVSCMSVWASLQFPIPPPLMHSHDHWYLQRETEAMRVGTHLHAALEMEVSETVEVQISTREDAWAVRLLNTLRGLHQLLETGLARELYVFGRIQVRALLCTL